MPEAGLDEEATRQQAWLEGADNLGPPSCFVLMLTPAQAKALKTCANVGLHTLAPSAWGRAVSWHESEVDTAIEVIRLLDGLR